MSVPDTATFSLTDVRPEITGESGDLVDCFAKAENYKFDIDYSGDKNSLYNFRNYGASLPSTRIGILNIKTRPWYSMSSPPSEKYNRIILIYVTGASYDDSSVLNISRGVKYQSDDSIFVTTGAVNAAFVNTSRPKELILLTQNDTTASAASLYFYLQNNNSMLRSLNPNITYIGTTTNLRMNFSLVTSGTVPTITLNRTTLEFYNDGVEYTYNNFTITTTDEWYIICPSWVGLTAFYGSGNATITISILSSNHAWDVISVYTMSNIAPAEIDIRVDA
jgi:hypothetical protein